MINGLQPIYKRNNIFQVRLTTPELEDIKVKAQASGFETISDFFRHIVLSYNTSIEAKIDNTNKNVKEILKILKNNKK